MREIIYWGAGDIGEQCFLQHPELMPAFFIDSFSEKKELFGKEIKRPDEIRDWSKYFVIITVKKGQEIENYLRLYKNTDYMWYGDYFSCRIPSVIEIVNFVQAFMEQCDETVRPILFFAPVVKRRKREAFELFLKTYAKKRYPQKVLLFTVLQTVSAIEIAERTGCDTFCRPDIEEWDGKHSKDGVYIRGIADLSIEELNWLKAMQNRKISLDQEGSLKYSQKMYCYYDTIMKITNPAEVIIWSGWTEESYILGHIAEVRGIPHGYMEYGWIPGTNQFDPCGIGGQGVYAVKPDVLDELSVDRADLAKVSDIKRYVVENQMDTRTFMKTEADDAELRKVVCEKKTILLVGMDENGMRMNPRDAYWGQYISGIYHSVEEVLVDLVDICTKNGYNLIFKPHPGEQPIDISKFDRSKMIYVKDASIDSLIQISDVAVSMASAVDYKVLMYEKPLVQVGITGLKGKKCSYEVQERDALEDKLNMALKNGMTKEQKDNFDVLLARLLKKYLWDDMSEKRMSYGLTLDTDFCEVI